jgi:hypothetical protein
MALVSHSVEHNQVEAAALVSSRWFCERQNSTVNAVASPLRPHSVILYENVTT